jgi:hypothetical protein
MSAEILKKEDCSLWDKFVFFHPQGCFYNLSGWVQALADSYGFKSYYIVKKDSGRIQSGTVVLETNSIFGGRKFSNNPFNLYSSFIFSQPEDCQDIIEFVLALALERRAKSIDLRTYNRLPNCFLNDYKAQEMNIRVIPVIKLEDTYERSAEGFKGKFRKNLSIIAKRIEGDRNFTCYSSSQPQEWQTFHTLLLKHYKNKHHAPTATFRFFLNLRRYFNQEYTRLYQMKYKDKVVAGAVILLFKEKAYYAWSASDPEFDSFAVSTFLLNHIIKDLCAAKIKFFDLGVTSEENQKLIFFKMRWGAELTRPFFYFIPLKNIEFKNYSAETSFLKARKIIKFIPLFAFRGLNYMVSKYLA